ncbi:hypothetical protein HNQ60_003456 [Povalibacter uvarum]|uniref:Uncharacterized protein n=1 Tax=Povalibacter uvarum TaxID=732238 RepID=A0A841HQG8_9GAMM|nr:hypothetical protein [Povalibacter uvarum]
MPVDAARSFLRSRGFERLVNESGSPQWPCSEKLSALIYKPFVHREPANAGRRKYLWT